MISEGAAQKPPMDCDRVRESLPLYLYGELSLDQEHAVEDHLSDCADCRQAMQAEKALHRLLDGRALEPPAQLLAACRQDLLRRLRQSSEAVTLGVRIREWLASAWRPWWRPAGALALLTVGFFAGRWIGPAADRGLGSQASDPPVTRVRLIEADPRGQVRIAVEETHRRILQGSPEDGRIQRLLLAAVREAADPSLRLESLELLRTRASQEPVRRALLEAVRSDPNPGVRLRALEALRPFASQPEVREVLARVLLEDRNPGVRIQAIDLLVEQRPQEAVVGLLQELLEREDNAYVRWRSQRALQEWNASVGTF